MKNIHVLPTPKPSRVYKHLGRELKHTVRYFEQKGLLCINQNIYITNSEEIKEGDYVLYHEDKISQVLGINIDELKLDRGGVWRSSCKKIILTTDQDLIKDGVQAIDDEFLEWFVKNPSCEYVVVKYQYWKEINDVGKYTYKIIIPSEEQKQHLIDMMKSDEELGLYDESREIKIEDIFNDEKREKVKRVIHQHKVLKDLSLVNPAHLQMTSNGHGEFPDGYKLTDKGIQYIIEQLNKE